jgi:hypothetical protein
MMQGLSVTRGLTLNTSELQKDFGISLISSLREEIESHASSTKFQQKSSKQSNIQENSYDLISAQSSGYLDESRASSKLLSIDGPNLKWSNRGMSSKKTTVSACKLINYIPTLHSKIKFPQPPGKTARSMAPHSVNEFKANNQPLQEIGPNTPLNRVQKWTEANSPFSTPLAKPSILSRHNRIPISTQNGTTTPEANRSPPPPPQPPLTQHCSNTPYTAGRCNLSLSYKGQSLHKLVQHPGDQTPELPELVFVDEGVEVSYGSSNREQSVRSARMRYANLLDSSFRKLKKVEIITFKRTTIKRPEYLSDGCQRELVSPGKFQQDPESGNHSEGQKRSSLAAKPPMKQKPKRSVVFDGRSRDAMLQLFSHRD